MQFVYPGFLFALSALSIPIIIHLFNFRRFRRILFTNVRFLQEIKQDTRSRSRLKHLLILLCRLLAVTFLVLAFAQPLIPAGKNAIVGGVKNVSVYIDNSYSMDAVGKNGSLVETAKKKAREIANAYQPADKFQLLTTDFEARHQRVVNREEFLEMVDEVKSGSSVRNLSEVITRQKDALKSVAGNEKLILYEISDFQKSVTDIDHLTNDSAVQINLVPLLPATSKNIFIDTCSLATPFVQLNSQNELTIKLRNISDDDVENVPVKLFINGSQRSLTSLTIPANSGAETKLSFSITAPGWQQAMVSISDDPVIFDDNYYLSFEVKDHLNVLSINEAIPSPYISALFGNDPYFQFHNASVSQLDYASFINQNLIVLNNLKDISSGLAQELKKYVNQGGALMVFPSLELNQSAYVQFSEAMDMPGYLQWIDGEDKVNFIEKKNAVFEDVFEKEKGQENIEYPSVTGHFRISGGARSNQEVLMRLQSGDVFLSTMRAGKGIVYLCASPLDESVSNFPRHALIVPVLLKAAMSGFNTFQPSLMVGRNALIELNNIQLTGDNILHLVNQSEKFDIIPETRMINNKPVIAEHGQVKTAGNYSIESNGKMIGVVSYNFDRRESDLSAYLMDDLKSLTESARLTSVNFFDSNHELTHTVAVQNEGIRLWKYCIWLALFFLACEILLIRFMSTTKPVKTSTIETK